MDNIYIVIYIITLTRKNYLAESEHQLVMLLVPWIHFPFTKFFWGENSKELHNRWHTKSIGMKASEVSLGNFFHHT